MGFVNTLVNGLTEVINKITDFFRGIWVTLQNVANSVLSAGRSVIHSITGIFSFAVVKPQLMAMAAASSTGRAYLGTVTWPAMSLGPILGIKVICNYLTMRGYIPQSTYNQGTAQVSFYPVITPTADDVVDLGKVWEDAVAMLGNDGRWIPNDAADTATNAGVKPVNSLSS